MNIFSRSINLNPFFPYMRQWFLNFFGSLLKKILNKKILLASMKIHLNTETCTESRHRILSLSLVGFLHVIISNWTGGKGGLNMHIMGGLRNNFQNHIRVTEHGFTVTGGFLNAERSSLKRVTIRIFKISKKQPKTLFSIFSITRQQKIKNHRRIYRKY